MERAKAECRIIRAQFTRCATQLEKFLAANVTDNICSEFKRLSVLYGKLSESHNNLVSQHLDIELDSSVFDEELLKIEEYDMRWFSLEHRVQKANDRDVSEKTVLSNQSGHSSRKGNNEQRHFKLPFLELSKYDGNIGRWISFWSQFKKIHNDDKLSGDDKFQYLLQAMEHGSSARELVETFPPIGDNYFKAVEQLKERFGRDEMIIEYYIRELLQLVLSQAKGVPSLSIRILYDKLTSQTLALESLGITKAKYAFFLYPLIESALPVDILKAWSRARPRNSSDCYLSELLDFVKREVEDEERIKLTRSGFGREASLPTACFATSSKDRERNVDTRTQTLVQRVCIWCDKTSHASSECVIASKMTFEERKEMLKEKKACFICLIVGHSAKRCRKHPRCIVCFKRHYPIMCSEILKPINNTENLKLDNNSVNSASTEKKTVFLQTLKVQVTHGNSVYTVRALLDTGAQCSFLKKNVVESLGLQPSKKVEMSNTLFGGIVTKKKMYNVYTITLKSLNGDCNLKMEALEEHDICGHLPIIQKDSILLSNLASKGVILTDCINDVSEINLLIGCDVLGTLYTGRSVRVDNSLLAVETKLGWTLHGMTTGVYCALGNVNTLFNNFFNVEDLWKLEIIGIEDNAEVKSRKVLESTVQDFFEKTIVVNDEKRYEVNLPFKDNIVALQSNFEIALKRLRSSTSRLIKLGILSDYNEVFEEWLKSDIIEVVENDDITEGHYLAHHAIVKESSATTKIRPVFNASGADKHGLTLNDCLEKGINLIELIPRLVINFRRNAIGVTADIKKAFLQISINPKDRIYLKFLWWRNINNPGEDIKTFRHRRVVFGVTTSPYLLSATILYHLAQFDTKISDILRNSFYVDNLIISVKNVEEMQELVAEANHILLDGGFELRCWEIGPTAESAVIMVPVLGLLWNKNSDVLTCKLPSYVQQEVTKRIVLSAAQSIFDPIGFTSPVSLVPKLIMQQCWIRNVDWDELIPDDLQLQMSKWLQELKILNDCTLPRRLSMHDLEKSKNSLHIFADASQRAYAACVFLRSELSGNVCLQLVSAKARVAPTKVVTMPRLELIAAVTSTRLANEAKHALNLNCKVYYWTDSSITLAWIKRNTALNIFVHNRVQEILKSTSVNDWYHVPGTMNPADLPSRGCGAETLQNSAWWNGPTWLKLPEECWPQSRVTPDEKEVQREIKRSCLLIHNSVKFSERLTYFSKYSKIIRSLAWCLRFIENSRNKVNNLKDDISGNEYLSAERKLFSILQAEYFHNLERVKSNIKLDIMLDKNGLMRVKTRLTLSDQTEEFILPFLLPGKNIIIERLVREVHCIAHVGSQTLISILRENFWIVGIRNLAKRVVRECMKCRRFSVKPASAPVAPLPVDRISCGAVFEVTGIDLAGPMTLTNQVKCWIVLFTCATYRAVHLELCTSLSTEDFMFALRRFLARRGNVKVIYTDNGTNFRGCSNILKSIDWKEVAVKTCTRKIVWRHICPVAPWWGGFWERMIRSLKDLLRRNLGKSSLNYVELTTILCEVETALNNRPLTYIAQDTENFKVLTPAMFLGMSRSGEETDFANIDGAVLTSRWRYLNKVLDDLKHRFRSEYIALLSQKTSRSSYRPVQVGEVVLVGSDDEKRINWPLGLVIAVMPGTDGFGRAARVRTARGECIRPLQRLFPLELSSVDSAVPHVREYVTRAGRSVRLPERLGC